MLVLENLKNIRKNTTVRKSERSKHASWSFYQLRQFIEYKAKLNGIEVKFVNPAYTSQMCSVCEHKDKKNRKGENFKCLNCGHTDHADFNSTHNIALRADVNLPIVTENFSSYKPLALAGGC